MTLRQSTLLSTCFSGLLFCMILSGCQSTAKNEALKKFIDSRTSLERNNLKGKVKSITDVVFPVYYTSEGNGVGDAMQEIQYQFNEFGNITSFLSLSTNGEIQNKEVYEYDKDNRIIRTVITDAEGKNSVHVYAYNNGLKVSEALYNDLEQKNLIVESKLEYHGDTVISIAKDGTTRKMLYNDNGLAIAGMNGNSEITEKIGYTNNLITSQTIFNKGNEYSFYIERNDQGDPVILKNGIALKWLMPYGLTDIFDYDPAYIVEIEYDYDTVGNWVTALEYIQGVRGNFIAGRNPIAISRKIEYYQ